MKLWGRHKLWALKNKPHQAEWPQSCKDLPAKLLLRSTKNTPVSLKGRLLFHMEKFLRVAREQTLLVLYSWEELVDSV